MAASSERSSSRTEKSEIGMRGSGPITTSIREHLQSRARADWPLRGRSESAPGLLARIIDAEWSRWIKHSVAKQPLLSVMTHQKPPFLKLRRWRFKHIRSGGKRNMHYFQTLDAREIIGVAGINRETAG